MPKYVVLGYVKHNGEKHQAGDILELTAKEAAPLLKLKSISRLHEPGEDKESGAPETGGRAREGDVASKAEAKTEAKQEETKPETDKGGKGDQKAAPDKGGKKS